MSTSHTPGPWRWQGEDYRGGWGWQLLVGPNGEGILCGQSPDGPYEKLRAFVPISPEFCKTGMVAPADSAPCVHVLQADAALIAAAPDMFAALKDIAGVSEFATSCMGWVVNKAKYAIENATGVSINNMTNFTDRERDLMRQVELARIDLDESDALRDKMGTILSRSVNAIRGEPAPLHRHSWHDLPELVEGIKLDLLAALLDKQQADEAITRLRGEAGVMRGLLTECAGIILAIDSESASEVVIQSMHNASTWQELSRAIFLALKEMHPEDKA